MAETSIDQTGIETADALIAIALEEDLQSQGDLTSQATIPTDATATVNVVAREEGTLCGGVLLERVYRALADRFVTQSPCKVQLLMQDGNRLTPGADIAQVSGSVRDLLSGERTALNFLMHLSGVASRTAEFVARAAGTQAVILDTRKTLPGYRMLQKYAVRCGGGVNHRIGLYDGVLIKDNHVAARQDGGIATAVAAARTFLTNSHLDLPVEIEVDTLEQLREVLQQQPEIVLLDNMRTAQLQQAVSIRDDLSPATLLEASGGVNLETIGCIAGTGVDRVSIGALTHSAPALDIGYDWPHHS